MLIRSARIAPLLLIAAAAAPAAAQFQSEGYKFLEAVKEAKGEDVTEALNKPGTTIVNTRDYSSRETALHIVARRNDTTYTRFLLQKGADPNLRDKLGDTPLMVAVTLGNAEVAALLITAKANVNLANESGETPLIRAVQRRNMALIRDLLAAGANPDQADSIAGKSARVYAQEDSRYPAIAKLFSDIVKQERKPVAGPKL